MDNRAAGRPLNSRPQHRSRLHKERSLLPRWHGNRLWRRLCSKYRCLTPISDQIRSSLFPGFDWQYRVSSRPRNAAAFSGRSSCLDILYVLSIGTAGHFLDLSFRARLVVDKGRFSRAQHPRSRFFLEYRLSPTGPDKGDRSSRYAKHQTTRCSRISRKTALAHDKPLTPPASAYAEGLTAPKITYFYAVRPGKN